MAYHRRALDVCVFKAVPPRPAGPNLNLVANMGTGIDTDTDIDVGINISSGTWA